MGKSISDTHEWRKIQDFREGDYVSALGQELLVTKVEVGEKTVSLFYVHNDEVKRKIGAVGDEYIAKKREG